MSNPIFFLESFSICAKLSSDLKLQRAKLSWNVAKQNENFLYLGSIDSNAYGILCCIGGYFVCTGGLRWIAVLNAE